MLLHSYLQALGLTSKEQEIFATTLQYGETNASKVAKHLSRERTSTYKLMKHLSEQGFLTHKKKSGTTVFSSISLEAIKQRFLSHQATLTSLVQQQHTLEQERKQLSSSYHHDTAIKMYEGVGGLQQTYQEIIAIIEKQTLIHISCFASATFESQALETPEISALYHDYLDKLHNHNVTTQSYLGTGLSLMEQLLVTTNTSDITSLPTSNEAIQLRLIGDHIFIMLFKRSPQIIHIHNTQLAALMHFIGGQLEHK